jgi:hypothetical protein
VQEASREIVAIDGWKPGKRGMADWKPAGAGQRKTWVAKRTVWLAGFAIHCPGGSQSDNQHTTTEYRYYLSSLTMDASQAAKAIRS